jgi:hypothetical protein
VKPPRIWLVGPVGVWLAGVLGSERVRLAGRWAEDA